jgi:hypothetical protein
VQASFNQLEPVLDVEGVLDDFSGDDRHVCRSPRKNVFVAPEEVDELTFLFQAQTGPNLYGLGWILNIDLDSLNVSGSFEGVGHGGHG